jgi:hypothetical protein
LLAGTFKHAAQQISEPYHHFHRGVVTAFPYERGNRVQRIEKKMWLHLAADGFELSLGKLLIQPRCLGSLDRQPFSGVQRMADGQNDRIQNDI